MKKFQKLMIALISLASLTAGSLAFAQAWPTEHQWTDQVPGAKAGYTYRDKYADYLAKEVKTDIFADHRHHFVGQPDCKRAVNLIPAVFACDNGLPFFILGGRLNNSTFKVSPNDSKEARAEKFMNAVYAGSTIQDVSKDTYPIRVDRKSVRGGTVILLMEGGGNNHSVTISSVDETGTIKSIYGTTSSEDKASNAKNTLWTREGLDPYQIHPYVEGQDGLRSWKFMVPPGRDYQSQPDYDANEQYTSRNPSFLENRDEAWSEAVERRLQIYTGEAIDDIHRLERVACQQIHVREFVVTKGEHFLQTNCKSNRSFEIIKPDPGSKTVSQAWEESSTPLRDSQLLDLFKELDEDLASYGTPRQGDPDVRKEKKDFFDNCQLRYGPGENQLISLATFESFMLEGYVSSNPNSSLDAKWGVTEDSDSTSTCNLHDGSSQARLLPSEQTGYTGQSGSIKRGR